SNSSTSRYDKEKRRYQPTARRMTSGSNCLHLNRPETDDARSIGPAYQTTPAKLQHCHLRGLKVPCWGFFRRQRIRTVMEPLRRMIWSCSLPTVYSRSRRQTTNITAQTGCWLRCASECTFPPDNYLAK